MDFEEYVNQITTKFKLAIATAVLTNKPTELTTDQYITQLREKINENIDIDDEELISSKDFDFEENSFNSDKNIDFDEIPNEKSVDFNTIDNKLTQCEETDQSMIVTIDCTENDETASIHSLLDYNIDLQDTLNKRIETNNVLRSRNDLRSPDSISEVLKTLREIDESNNFDEGHNMTNLTQDIFGEYSQMTTSHNNNICEENMAIDNQPFVNKDRDDFTIIDERLNAKVAKIISRNKEICILSEQNINTTRNMQDLDEEIPRNLIDTTVTENQKSVKDFARAKTVIVAKSKITEKPREIVQDKGFYNSQNFGENIPDTNMSISDNLSYDTQQTILYTYHGLTDDTQISQSQCNNIEIPNKFIFGPKLGTNNNNVENIKTAKNNEILNKTTEKVNPVSENTGLMTIDPNQIEYIIDKTGKTYAVLQRINVNDNPKTISHKKDRNKANNSKLPSQINEFDKHDASNSKTVNMKAPINNTGDSQTQKETNSHSEFLENRSQKASNAEISENRSQNDFNTEFSQNDRAQNDFNTRISENSRTQSDFDTGTLVNRTQKDYNLGIAENYRNQSDFDTEFSENDRTQCGFDTGTLENRTQKDYKSGISENYTIQKDLNTEFSENDRTQCDFDTGTLENRTQEDLNSGTLENRTQKDLNTEILEIDEDEEMSSNDTEVPFKVVKELDKIKSYLYRERTASTDGFFSDSSGYKSDSQSSLRSAHLSESWMHESAYCLYSHIVQCTLVAGTQKIVTEIAEVIGKLIDKLHEEEKYPNFVEKMLDKIDYLLRELYEGDNSSENVLLEKDEIIQRLLLLNKSTHILKFTIDKISGILDKTRTNLTTENSSYELTNIGEIENLCYIFNLLEMLLKKYIKMKNNLTSQSTQNSQETKILKKSSISEIWRKKWNANLKEIKNVGSQQKVCCLEKCGGVLNKIIVECIGGYSLISYAALQCFNLLQNP